jgi:hypothetical protein
MPRQVSDEEYAYLQGRRQIADFVEPIWNDPALSADAKALVKRKYPQAQIPGYDEQQLVRATFAEERKKLDDEKAAQVKATNDEKWKKERAEVQGKYSITEEGMQELEQFMWDNNIGHYEAAAMLKFAREPRPSGATYDTGHWNYTSQPDYEKIVANPEKWGREQLMEVLTKPQEKNIWR